MSENFLRFKKKSDSSRILKSLLYGISVGLFSAGLFLLLAKLAILNVPPIISLPVGVVACLLVGGLVYFFLKKSDEKLARELDREFGLNERVETMLAYKDEMGTMLDLQREDTEKSLGNLDIKQFKIPRLWISIIALCVGFIMFLSALFVPNLQAGASEKEIPFELSQIQRVGLEELIEGVNKSQMEEPYKSEISEELTDLLADLETTKTQKDMQWRLSESMAYILASTSNSSSMTEIANSLWDTGDEYARGLAIAIDTTSWTRPDDWGDYAEKLAKLLALYNHIIEEDDSVEGEQTIAETLTEEELHAELKWKVENSAKKISFALKTSKISEEDALYLAISELIYVNYDDKTGPVLGFEPLTEYMENFTYEETLTALGKMFEITDEGIYNAISVQKVNTNVGENVMTQLSTLFFVPLPSFERPELVGSGNSSSDKEEDKENNGSQGGGIGEGATYGSDDYVLDPTTGEYVKYGTLLAKYNALMMAKLESGNYTEEQKESIKKYFELLYSGIKKDEGSQK